MKSSKSNNKIPVATRIFLRHPRYDVSAKRLEILLDKFRELGYSRP